MNKGQTAKLTYVKPEAEVLHVGTDFHLLNGSFTGDHDDAEDDQELNAKQGFFEDEATSWPLWD